MSINNRKIFVDDFLHRKLGDKYQKTPKPLSHDEQLYLKGVKVWQHVETTILKPLLKACKDPTQYNRAGTQALLRDAFVTQFSTFSKEELLFFVALMHTEELSKQADQIVEQGLVGDHLDKPI